MQQLIKYEAIFKLFKIAPTLWYISLYLFLMTLVNYKTISVDNNMSNNVSYFNRFVLKKTKRRHRNGVSTVHPGFMIK